MPKFGRLFQLLLTLSLFVFDGFDLVGEQLKSIGCFPAVYRRMRKLTAL